MNEPTHRAANVPMVTSHVALHLLINQLMQCVAPLADERQNTLTNEISPFLLVRTNPGKLGMVIRQLLTTINNHAENTSIRLSAKMYGDVLLLHIKKKCTTPHPGFAEHLQPLQQMAREFYGDVSITSHRNDITTVALSFMNQCHTA